MVYAAATTPRLNWGIALPATWGNVKSFLGLAQRTPATSTRKALSNIALRLLPDGRFFCFDRNRGSLYRGFK